MAEDLNIELTPEERHKKDLERLAKLRPIDDTLMRELFRNNMPLAQRVLRIITNIDDLTLVEEETQYDMERLLGARSVCLDVMAVDSEGRRYDLEVQRSDKGAAPKRARYHSAGMDVDVLNIGDDFDKLPITYVILFTENDVRGKGRPIHFFTRMDMESKEPFGDDEYIIYVNGAYQNKKDNSELAKLIHDFKCSNADEMYIKELAETTRYYKENTKGVSEMCKVMEEMKEETLFMGNCRTAVRMLKRGKYSFTEIAEDTELSIATVKKLAEKYVPEAIADPE